jgi:translocation and assembly module TamB
MVDDTDLDEPQAPDIAPAITVTKRRYWLRWIFGVVALLLLLLLAVAYWQRLNIADRLVKDALEKYDVRASYRIKDIGWRTQRLEDVVVGDPANPDFVAKSVDVDVSINFDGVTPQDIRAHGVKLYGRYADAKLSFGELDKFSDPESKEPINIPDIGVKLSDAQMRLDTPWGRIGAGLNGEGLLRQRFEGNLALRSAKLQYEDCAADAVRFDGGFVFDFRQPILNGPWTAGAVKCSKAGYAAIQPKIDGELRLSEQFDKWFGNVNFAAQSLRSGDMAVSRPRGTLAFDGKKERTNFDAKLDGASYASKAFGTRNLLASAKGFADFGADGVKVTSRGTADIVGGRLAASMVSGVDALVKNAANTPVAPLLKRMAPAVRRAVADFDARLRYDAAIGGGQTNLLIDGTDVITRSGVKASQSGIAQLRQRKDSWALISPLRLAMSGGDLPGLRLALKQGPGPSQWSGDLAVDRYAADNASLALSKLNFAGRPGGAWSFNGNALLTGPLPGGFVSGLRLPLDGRYDGRNFVMYQSCQNIVFDALKYETLSLAKQNIRLCPDQGSILQAGGTTKFSANLPSFAFDGRYAGSRIKARTGNVRFNLDQGFTANNVTADWGDSPIRVKTPIIRFNFKNGFTSENVHVETGTADALTFFDVPRINGRFTRAGLAGKLEGAGGQIANVPFIMSEAMGDWTLIRGDVALQGSLNITDAAEVDRFKPLNVPDVLLTFEQGVVNVLGNLHEPTTGRKVAGMDIRHAFNSGTGRALIAVDDLAFDKKLQPEMLTNLTLGVIQNVEGTVYGDGSIVWDTGRDGIVSTGTFGTKGLDFAAAFGPVRGLRTEMKFSDLIALATEPTQTAQIASINPGVAALDGVVRYRLLPDQKVQIEGGSWPFAGGQLVIQPTIWDFDVDAKRELVLEVKGIEISKFIETMELSNLSATGVFDGRLPMVFDADGGQIVGGELIARPGGGNISYIGELTYKDLSPYANFAFDALRSIDYSGLRIGMRGNLAGEIITDISFQGIKQGKGAKQNFITRQLADVPIKFNIRIEAQFFELFGSVRSIYDPQYLVDRNRREIIRKLEANAAAEKAAAEKATPPKPATKPDEKNN